MNWPLVLLIHCAAALPPKLIWIDEFNYLDTDVWSHLVTSWGGGNEEFQYYRNDRRNSFVKDGKLHIRPTFTADEMGEDFLLKGNLSQPGCNFLSCFSNGNGYEITSPVFSARISTQKSFAFKFGRVEVRAKMPRGDWLWPAIWMLPKNESIYGGWPRGGEIDIVEVRGNKNYVDDRGQQQGVSKMGATLHFGPSPGENAYQLANFGSALKRSDFSDDFHTYSVDWNNYSIAFAVDGIEFGKVKPHNGDFWQYGGFRGENIWANGSRMAPFDQEFYLTINLAVGGKFFPDGWLNDGQPRPWTWRGKPKREFWEARNEWEPTWVRPELIIDHILIYGSD